MGWGEEVVLSQALPLLSNLRCATTISETQFTYLYRDWGANTPRLRPEGARLLALRHAWRLPWQLLAGAQPPSLPPSPASARLSLPEAAATSALLTLTADREALPGGEGP